MQTVPVVFLDRDGTINIDPGFLHEPEKVALFPGAADALAKLKRAGCKLVIVTNQSGIGRGVYSAAAAEATNKAVCDMLQKENHEAVIDEVAYCPHVTEDGCSCRKPKTGLADPLLRRWKTPAERCWVIGDKKSDIEFGLNVGIPKSQALLVLTGEGTKTAANIGPDVPRVPSLKEAAELILQSINLNG